MSDQPYFLLLANVSFVVAGGREPCPTNLMLRGMSGEAHYTCCPMARWPSTPWLVGPSTIWLFGPSTLWLVGPPVP